MKDNPIKIRKIFTIYQGALKNNEKMKLNISVRSGETALNCSISVRGIKIPMMIKIKPITTTNILATTSDTSTNSTYISRIRERE
jgi:hypothetical protein